MANLNHPQPEDVLKKLQYWYFSLGILAFMLAIFLSIIQLWLVFGGY